MEMWWNVYITIQKLCKALYSNIEDATTGTSSQGQTDLQGYPIVHLRLMFKHVLVAKKNQSNAKHNKHDTYFTGAHSMEKVPVSCLPILPVSEISWNFNAPVVASL